MMYRPDRDAPSNSRNKFRGRGRVLSFAMVFAMAAIVLLAFVIRNKNVVTASILSTERIETTDVPNINGDTDKDCVERIRIVREYIPEMPVKKNALRDIFNDSNYVQLSAARANGIDVSVALKPSMNDNLVRINSTDLYRVDTMYHSEPFLVPEAALLLQLIAIRFKELINEKHPSFKGYKPIVTSALRTEMSERRLRRVNRNATDTSCHIYGTTFDISSQRFESDYGCDTVVGQCKQILALALYELRYEGLCYVKYERGSCFHITLITTQYNGSQPSHRQVYYSPKAATKVTTMAPKRPAYRKNAGNNYTNAPLIAKSNNGASAVNRYKSGKRKETTTTSEVEKSGRRESFSHELTERERLSLNQFERNY